MFYDIFVELCAKKGISLSKAAESIDLNRTAVIKWKNGAIPNGNTLERIADYFDVSLDYLLEKNGDPTRHKETEKSCGSSEMDIAKDLESIIVKLRSNKPFTFKGEPLSKKSRESVLAAIELGLQAAELNNKRA